MIIRGSINAAVLLLALGALFLSANRANACSCARPSAGVLEQLRQGAVVAEGAPVLLSGQPANGIRYAPVRYEFRVFKSVGARLPDRIIVETADNSASCGVNLSGRKTAVLRLLPGDESGVYHVNLCSQLSVQAFEKDWRTLLDAVSP